LAKKTVKKKAKRVGKKRPTGSVKKKAKAPARKKSSAAPKQARPKTTVKKSTTSRTAPAAKKKTAGSATARGLRSKKRTVAQRRTVSRGNGTGDPATKLDPVVFPEKPRKKVKTYLTAKQLREFKALLEQKRAQLCGDVQRLTSEALRKGSDGGGDDHSFMPIHMADVGSDNWEQEFALGLIANEESLVRDIDEALARIEDKTYGMCLATQKPISVARLQAKPWAKYGIEYARMRDEGRLS